MPLPEADSRPADRRPAEHSPNEGLPPFVKTWRQMYAIIAGVLLLLIVLFYAFMINFQ
ncbi:hypothetical protein [Persicitalea sp.]|uniref:hypothetical protein n=1 Tax=Persicitalea sp. TaxID=3100273 RepID=UPI003593103E